jgi:hypothetical protein
MPAYSFKERFVPMILDGSKRQTIRNKRKAQAKPGSTLYLYFGMRTKWCTKLKETTCRQVEEIIIKKDGTVTVDNKKLSPWQKDCLAYSDGFRNEQGGSRGAFDVMFRWWNQTHSLPFKGDIIYW